MTSQPQQDVIGRGEWKDGTWKAVMARPLATIDPSDTQFSVGTNIPVAFAVWDGANNEVNGRKSVSAWIVLNILREGEVAPQPSAPGAATPSAGMPFGIAASIGLLVFSIVFIIAAIVLSNWKTKQLNRRSIA
ncbi:MAG: hypothetical protein HYU02_06845 [Thaumarchaeota archaeon]|nr:hypothetical protein [Nitrososphaerota archaeon]